MPAPAPIVRASFLLLAVFGAGLNMCATAEPWWSLRELRRPDVPAGAAHPVDAFVRARLVEHGLSPSPLADRRTLLRRLSYDLTGLPPSPEDMAAYLGDPDTDARAFERQVDRLLASPRYGEHWARHWLDVANYADTHGNDHDYARPNAWPYRDYVIGAFNDDKPFARFVEEQIAGDVLHPGDPQATVALGFLAAGPWDHTLMVTVREDTVDHRQAQNLDRDAMVGAVFGTFQSLTVPCARCHSHKFDPVSQREYYSLQAVFAGVDRADRPFDADAEIHARRARLRDEKWRLDHPTPAFLDSLDAPGPRERVQAWETAWKTREEAWSPLDVVGVVSTGGASLSRQEDGSWFAEGLRPERDTYVVTARWRPGPLRAVRLEVLPDDRLPQKGPGRWDNGNFHLTEFRAFAATNAAASAVPIVFGRATADFDEGPTISAAQAIDGKNETQWGVHPRYGEPHEAVFEAKEPRDWPANTLFTFLLENQAGAPGHGIGRFRIRCTPQPSDSGAIRPVEPAIAAILRTPTESRSPEQRRTLALFALRDLNRVALEALPAPRQVYAVTRDFSPDGANFHPSAEPRPIHVLSRGDLARPGERVGPASLSCIPGLPGDLKIGTDGAAGDEGERRAALARWLVDGRNVLTWRSIVNRAWAWHFGRGLCDTPNDFGRMGGAPSHPELLDWLAVWFRDDARGSWKALHRLLLTSETWRQSTLGGHGTALDPDNRWLWRQNRTRLPAEPFRDTLLVLADRLDTTMGGPPAIQFNHRGDATFNSGGAPAYLDYDGFDPDSPAARRRAIYRFLFRTVPDPLMDALDCPDGSVATASRASSTTAVQALALMNDPFVLRQCEHIARRLAASTTDPATQATQLFHRILARAPSAAEETRFADYIRRHGLANAVQWLINANEFLYLD